MQGFKKIVLLGGKFLMLVESVWLFMFKYQQQHNGLEQIFVVEKFRFSH